MTTFEVEHRTDYAYDDLVHESYGRAHLVPREEPGQHVVSAVVGIDPAPEETHEHVDFYGNRSSYFRVAAEHAALAVTSTSRVEIARAAVDFDAIVAPVGAGADVLAREHLLASPMVPAVREIAAYAAVSFDAGRPTGDALRDLLARIKADFTYETGSTSVNTPIQTVLRKRTGVCQDFAHLMIGCLRSAGVPARYVSGYLETVPPPGKPHLVGVDASHAWVSAYVAGAWVDLDPTNNQAVDDRYIVLARGRDYADVPPLKGVIFTKSTSSTLRVAVTVRRV